MILDSQLHLKWNKGIKRHRNFAKHFVDSISNTDQLNLHSYVNDGFFPDTTSSFPKVKPVPEFEGWENAKLGIYTATVGISFQAIYYLETVDDGAAAISHLANSFRFSYVSFLIEIYMLNLNERRFGFRESSSSLERSIPYIAFGYLVAEEKRAERMAKLAIKSFNNEWMSYRQYPIFTFMLSILADYLDEAPPEFLGKAKSATELQQLLLIWKDPNPDRIKELCLLACDFHIKRCRNDSVKELFEFSNLPYHEWPIAINLLFKLREKLGLQNPELDHPLMNSPLGKLPEVVPFEYDPLLIQVMERMKSQGFDEEKVFETIYYER